MEKYQHNRDIKPESLFTTIFSVSRFVLIVVGILGISIEFFRDEGWLKTAISKMMNSDLGMYSFLILFGGLYLVSLWVDKAGPTKASKRGDMPFNVMMLIGVYFVYHWIATGSI